MKYILTTIKLLPSENKPTKNTIWKHVYTNELSLWKDVMSVDKNWYPFEMYFIDPLSPTNNIENSIIIDGVRKEIIATTNDEIFFKPHLPNFGSYMSLSLGVNYPKPTNDFIKWFCEQGGVNSVEVEYEVQPIQYSSKVASDGNYEGYCPLCNKYSHWMGSDGMICYDHFKLKIYEGNFINIKINKTKTWSQEEVEKLLLKREQHIQDNFAPNKTILNINTWIEQNLS